MKGQVINLQNSLSLGSFKERTEVKGATRARGFSLFFGEEKRRAISC